MRALAQFSRNLRALDIRGCWRITDKGMNLVAEYCPRLVVLSVLDCRDITERSLSKLRRKNVRIDRPLDPFYASNGTYRKGPPGMDLRLQV